MSLFLPYIIIEEEIFTPRNLGSECDTVCELQHWFGDKFIFSALEYGEYAIAVNFTSSCWIRSRRTLSRMSIDAGLMKNAKPIVDLYSRIVPGQISHFNRIVLILDTVPCEVTEYVKIERRL